MSAPLESDLQDSLKFLAVLQAKVQGSTVDISCFDDKVRVAVLAVIFGGCVWVFFKGADNLWVVVGCCIVVKSKLGFVFFGGVELIELFVP